MANQRSTRVQRICKKLQTVKGVGWSAAWSGAWPLEIFWERKKAAEIFWGSFSGRGCLLAVVEEIFSDGDSGCSEEIFFKGEAAAVKGPAVLERNFPLPDRSHLFLWPNKCNCALRCFEAVVWGFNGDAVSEVCIIQNLPIPFRPVEADDVFATPLNPFHSPHTVCTHSLYPHPAHVTPMPSARKSSTVPLSLRQFKLGLRHGHRVIPWGDLDSLAMLQRQLDVDILVTASPYDVNPSFVLMDIDGAPLQNSVARNCFFFSASSNDTHIDQSGSVGDCSNPPGGPMDSVRSDLHDQLIDAILDVVRSESGLRKALSGGSVTAGMAIFDTMRHIRPDVPTDCARHVYNSAVLKQAAGGETPPPPQQSLPSAAALSFTFHQQEHDPTSVHCHLCRNGSYHDPFKSLSEIWLSWLWVRSGVPATVEHLSTAATSAAAVVECVQHFIIATDSLKLNVVAVDNGVPINWDLITNFLFVLVHGAIEKIDLQSSNMRRSSSSLEKWGSFYLSRITGIQSPLSRSSVVKRKAPVLIPCHEIDKVRYGVLRFAIEDGVFDENLQYASEDKTLVNKMVKSGVIGYNDACVRAQISEPILLKE
ncbi:Vacuolar protein sorting-associated protein 29 [Vitis vinifera]|uniref:Vacuolar protein sorting-associated protein 29 n=1 Tax=Vitis vinifera TaxID=29760 RepID=A0A438GFZ9_VITVI|nr:Vacuolar protein sorting-associated protein 29 [Vitis vinifera]